jgi:hypothetical protein
MSISKQENNKMRVIEYIGTPSAGKTTTSVAHWAELKKDKSITCEFIREKATECVYESGKVHHDHLYLLADYYNKLKKLAQAGVDVVVTDSSSLLMLYYNTLSSIEQQNTIEAFIKLIEAEFDIERRFVYKTDKHVNPKGRVHTDYNDILRIEKELLDFIKGRGCSIQ